jgi:hypothetical protein
VTPLTPAQLIADIKSLDRIENDWNAEGRLDAVTEEDLHAKRADLLDELRERFNTQETDGPFRDWAAWQGDLDYDHNGFSYVPTMPIAYGKTELEAIECLLDLIGEDA